MKRRQVLVIAAVVVLTLAAAIGLSRPLVAWFMGGDISAGKEAKRSKASAGAFSLEVGLQPDPPRQEGNTLFVDVKDASGQPVDDADVTVEYVMPAMGSMSQMKGTAKVDGKDAGSFTARFDLPMAGSWTLTTRVRSPQGSGEVTHSLTVGKKGLTLVSGSGAAGTSQAADESARDHAAHGGAVSDPNEVAYHTCSMHPSVKQGTPGTCPICNMNLTPVMKGELASGVIVVDDIRRQKIGVKTARIDMISVETGVTTVGRVAYDEEKLRDITLKFGGFVEKLFVDKTGQRVKEGEPLFLLYSPEVYAAQIEYLQARKTATTLKDSVFSQDLLRSARKRLELWGIGDQQIEKLIERGEATDRMPIPSPVSGYVIEKHVVAGSKVDAGMTAYRLANLDTIWIEAEVYEADLPKVWLGQPAKVTLPYLPGKELEGNVAFVYPFLTEGTRTGRVRIELKNPGLELKPAMYANVMLQGTGDRRLVVPESAVIYTGPRRLVFVDLGEGRLKPVVVKLGNKSERGVFTVLEGLNEGDLVVTSGNFLIAAESRLKGAAEYWADDMDAAAASSHSEGASWQPAEPSAPPATGGSHGQHR